MAQATSAFQDETAGKVERGRGGFYRGFNDVPYIADPTGATVKSGPRKGLPKRIPYGSPSGAGKLIENTYNLQKWSERMVLLGLGIAAKDGDFELFQWCWQLATLDQDSIEFKELADKVAVRCREIAEANIAAERGTFTHAQIEDLDEGRDWLARAAEGQLLGISVDAQQAIAAAWNRMLERAGLEILVTEASCVDDTLHLAGTLDNVARCTRELRFAKPGGEVAVVPAGTVLVLDKKTGQLRRAPRSQAPMYWQAYSIQIASYAQSVPYDTEAETRGVWPWPIDQTHALIAHIDVLGAISGAPVEDIVELVHVDLVAGREHGAATVVAAKAWEKRDDIFSIAMLDADADGIAAEPDPKYCARCDTGGHVCGGCGTPIDHGASDCGADCTGPAPAPEPPTKPTPNDGHEHEWGKVGRCLYCSRCHVRFGAHGTIVAGEVPASLTGDPSAAGADVPPAAAPAAPSPLRQAQLDRAAAIAAAEARRLNKPDEGADLSGPDWEESWGLLKTKFMAQTRPQLDWTGQLVKEAREAGCEFQQIGGRTARRWELYRAVITLAATDWPTDTARTEAVRMLAATVTNEPEDDRPLGAVIGALDAAQAHRFADMVAQLYDIDLAASAA